MSDEPTTYALRPFLGLPRSVSWSEPDRAGVTMMTGLSHSGVFVLDQDRAKAFYTEKLGLEVRNDISMGEGFEGIGAGFRWLTVAAPGQPCPESILADCSMGDDPETAEQVRSLSLWAPSGEGCC